MISFDVNLAALSGFFLPVKNKFNCIELLSILFKIILLKYSNASTMCRAVILIKLLQKEHTIIANTCFRVKVFQAASYLTSSFSGLPFKTDEILIVILSSESSERISTTLARTMRSDFASKLENSIFPMLEATR